MRIQLAAVEALIPKDSAIAAKETLPFATNLAKANVLLWSMAQIDLSRLHERSPEPTHRKRDRSVIVILVLLLAISIFTYLNFQSVVVQGRSMEPGLRDGDRLLVTRAFWLFGSPQRDDVVVIRERDDPGSPLMVKRVVGLGGDTVPAYLAPGGIPTIVPDKDVYVIGDNLAVSEDSRRFGPVPASRIVGKVVK
jgi:signal peptidase I